MRHGWNPLFATSGDRAHPEPPRAGPRRGGRSSMVEGTRARRASRRLTHGCADRRKCLVRRALCAFCRTGCLGSLRRRAYDASTGSQDDSAWPSSPTSIGVCGVCLKTLASAARFEKLIISSEVGCEKPDPGIFQRALEVMDVAAECCLHAGDDPERDWAGAAAAGIAVFRVRRPRVTLDDLMVRPATEAG